jgi:hypothetical protein
LRHSVWGLKAAFALICAALCWELIARNLVFFEPADIVLSGLGHIHPAGWELHSSEGFSRTWFDGNGLRGRIPPQRPHIVILAIGSSYTEADQVSDDETYCAKLQASLSSHGMDVWVANAGKNGGSPARYVAVATWYKANLHPDRVVVQLDQRDFLSQLLNSSQEYYLELGDREPVLKSKVTDTKPRLGIRSMNSSLYTLAMAKVNDRQAANSPQKTPPTSQLHALVQWTVANLKKAYADPILVYTPAINYFADSPPNPVEDMLQRECLVEGIRLVNVRQKIEDTFKSTGLVSHGFSNTVPGEGHMNSLGHTIIADQLAQVLLAER